MKTQRSDEVLRGGSGHVSLEPPKWAARTKVGARLTELAADTSPCSGGLEAVKEALRARAGNSRVDASVALLRAMDREPRSYLADVLRAVHANADRGELDNLLRAAFGPSTAAQMKPRAWLALRDRFAAELSLGPEADRGVAVGVESDGWAYTPNGTRGDIAGMALFAHLMAFATGEI